MESQVDQTLDEALIRLQGTGPEFHHGLSNHGPMVSEALVRLGRSDAVERWLDGYLGALDPSPAAGQVLSADGLRDVLGNARRYADLLSTANAQLEDVPWSDVVGGWTEMLLPGASAAAFHGIIRTAHAVRGLEEAETPARRMELAAGLAYWGSAYQELPGTPSLGGDLPVAAALERMPRLPAERRVDGLITDDVRQVADVAGFGEAVDSLVAPVSAPSALSELTRVMAGWYLANARVRPIAFVHGVTGPAALRLLLPYLSPESQLVGFGYLWQVCAALCATCADFSPTSSGDAATMRGEQAGAVDRDEVIERAVEGGGAHAIKLVEACLREDVLAADPVYWATAADGSARMRY